MKQIGESASRSSMSAGSDSRRRRTWTEEITLKETDPEGAVLRGLARWTRGNRMSASNKMIDNTSKVRDGARAEAHLAGLKNGFDT